MEQGSLPSSGVSDRVLEALAQIFGQSAEALRRAGAAFGGPPPASGPRLLPRRSLEPGPASPAAAPPADAPAAAGEPDAEEWDEVDRLFRGG